MEKFKKLLPFVIPPAAVMLIMGVNFYINEMFPFGDGTVSWCDMSQQVIPLLTGFKDILSGDSGVFLNFNNAGGMNMWAVIFFFIASPFTLLVTFVKKTQMIYFVNILLLLKLMTCSVTSMVYFRSCQKKLPVVFACILSVVYAFCGYAMLFYQNIIWLDMMYLFPLLLAAFDCLFDKKKIAPYTAVMTAFMIVNYYISYMIVLYVLLFMSLFCFRYRKEPEYKQVPALFVTGSFFSAALSAAVWLPCFLQYLSSGRTSSVFDELASCGFFSRYETTIPMLLCSSLVIVVTAVCTMDGRPRSKKLNTYLIMLFLMLLPVFIEPVNVMWHTGSYMSFPARYGFITIYLGIVCAGFYLGEDENRKYEEKKSANNIFVMILCLLLVSGYFIFSRGFSESHIDEITEYAQTLWGNETSFLMLLELFIISAAAAAVYFLLYKKGLLSRNMFAIFAAAAVAMESFTNLNIYVTYNDVVYPQTAVHYQATMDLSDRIDDSGGFYRVKTTSKIFDINLVGAMGYNSLSHYTSLTSRNYMYMMKQLGYSSYWMEVGSYGGTELTDALLSVKYVIGMNDFTSDAVYSNTYFAITGSEYYLPMGVVTKSDLSDTENIDQLARSDVQELIYDKLFAFDSGDKILTEYEYTDIGGVEILSEKPYSIKAASDSWEKTIEYNIKVEGRQSLYFDCFDKLSNSLKEKINGSFSILVNGKEIQSDYPSQDSNGLLKLGEFENTRVLVQVKLLAPSVDCKSFGVYGIDLDKLDSAFDSAKTVGMTQDGGKLSGTYTAEAGDKCLLSIPYQNSLRVTVNGEKADIQKAFGDMISFDLQEGKNEIVVTNLPLSFAVGGAISVVGIILCVVFAAFRKKIRFSDTICTAFSVMLMGVGVLLVIGIYVVPVAVNIICI